MKRLFISNPNNDGVGINEMHQIYNDIRYRVELQIGEPVVLQNIPIVMMSQRDILMAAARRFLELSLSDIAFFADGWELFLSSRLEHECAVNAGLVILTEQNLENFHTLEGVIR